LRARAAAATSYTPRPTVFFFVSAVAELMCSYTRYPHLAAKRRPLLPPRSYKPFLAVTPTVSHASSCSYTYSLARQFLQFTRDSWIGGAKLDGAVVKSSAGYKEPFLRMGHLGDLLQRRANSSPPSEARSSPLSRRGCSQNAPTCGALQLACTSYSYMLLPRRVSVS
jgi:hypothetical protein